METNRLKRFASEARNILMSGVKQRLSALGFQADGSVPPKLMPELKGGGSVFMGEVQSEDFYHKWMSLYHRIQSHSYREVAEEAAYTWFNRLVAIRIMVKNELVPAVLEYESEDVRIPLLVSEARQRRFPQMNEESRQKLEDLLSNDALTDEQFAVLIVAYCHSNPIIHKCFGTISDYTELLLPSNILAKDGFIDKLNADEYINDEDYRSPELIGWLYQFYISERKDEVFAKKAKFEADEIPAATQIFTPNWIVKYMVQNTVGRIYLDNNPYTDLKKEMQYLVEPAEPTPVDAIYQFDNIHDLTCADLACGSGHILNECFDLLYQIYIEEGYNRKKAVEDIFRYNLTGIDIDMRAKQLATFALLMKACQKDASFVDAHCMPRVLDMPVSYAEAMGKTFDTPDEERAFIESVLSEYIMGGNAEVLDELTEAILLMNNAQTLGSIMKFAISERTRNVIAVRTAEYEQQEVLTKDIRKMLPYMRIILTLTQSYAALVMNPPYMYSTNMPPILIDYVQQEYEKGRTDLFAAFMHIGISRLIDNGKSGLITPQSWMFLISYESLRRKFIEQIYINSFIHLGPHTFDELSGEVVQNCSFVFSNSIINSNSIFYQLIEYDNCEAKRLSFFEKKHRYILNAKISFPLIPGLSFGYWASENILSKFISSPSLKEKAYARVGMFTGNNDRFLREWWEVSNVLESFACYTNEESIKSKKKWFAYNKGSGFKKWYGNNEYVVNYKDNGYEIFKLAKQDKRNCQNYPCEFKFREGVTWNGLSTVATFRYLPNGFLFDSNKGPMIFATKSHFSVMYLIAFLNTNVCSYITYILNPTLSTQIGDILNIPILSSEKNIKIEEIAKSNISISRQDWDAHETSWDFTENEFVKHSKRNSDPSLYNFTNEGKNIPMESWSDKHSDFIKKNTNSLECLAEQIKAEWEDKFMELHHNEEELNRQFIEIYGLQDELTPDVPLSEITILQQGEISIEQEKRTDNGRRKEGVSFS